MMAMQAMICIHHTSADSLTSDSLVIMHNLALNKLLG